VARWNHAIRASANQDGTVIDILDVIGEDWWTGEGITAKRVSAALKSSGDVTVNINSPGGDVFEGIAIYSLLQMHPGRVVVNVLGLAASAASVIAMAGDTIAMAPASFLMIHNTWMLAAGDRHDMTDASAFLAPFDSALADLYAARSGAKASDVSAMMDDETWMSGSEAVAKGFADAMLTAGDVSEDASAKASRELRGKSALGRVDRILAHHMPRSERRALIKDLTGITPRAEPAAMPSAGLARVAEELRRTNSLLR
jgi:ATP-dependent protease ClpP protease subunit